VISRDKLALLPIVAKGCALLALGTFALAVPTVLLVDAMPRVGARDTLGIVSQVAALVVILLLPLTVAALWVSRQLRREHSPAHARYATKLFLIAAPLSLMLAMPLGTLSGAYVGDLLGTWFALAGAFAGVVLITTLLVFVVMVVFLHYAAWPIGDEQRRGTQLRRL
jgi:hypothetical protein